MLQITCHNGEKRIINEHPTFYKRDGLMKGVNMKVTIQERCLSFAHSLCNDIARILLVSNGVVQFERNYPKVSDINESLLYKENSDEVKALRKAHKNERFTQKWNFTTGKFTNLITRLSAEVPFQAVA